MIPSPSNASPQPVFRPLGDDLILRSVQNEADAERFAAFNGQINDEEQSATCRALLHHHPTAAWAHFWLVEETTTGAVVSTTCLIPWTVDFCGVPLAAAMLEMVVTHPDYRRRGLVRTQIEHFHATVAAAGYDFAIIEGIPYYYRQFGYGYATDHEVRDTLPSLWVPPGDDPPLHLAAATPADIPTLAALARGEAARLDISTQRSEAHWRYLLAGAHVPVWLIQERGSGEVLGYCVVSGRHDGQGVIIGESAIPRAATARRLLQLVARQGTQIELGWPAQQTLVQVARSLGSRRGRGGDQWLIRLTDPGALLAKLGPVWAQRLAASPWAGYTGDLVINHYRQAWRLRFAEGALAGVDPLGFVDASMGADGGDLCIPPDAFVRLLFGVRTLDQLADAWPDMGVRPSRRSLIETLFPPLATYLSMPYMSWENRPRLVPA